MEYDFKRAVWPKVKDVSQYQGVNFIHPWKQKKVEELINYTKNNYPNIKAIAIFGSSVTPMCELWSDIDIVLWGEECKFLHPDNDVYDVLWEQDIPKDSVLWQDILREGVVVYG